MIADTNQNWIPQPFQEAARKLATDAVDRFLKKGQIVGLGSGPMAAAIVKEMASFDGKESLRCIPSSFQIKLEAERSGLELVEENLIPEIDVVFDGADEIDRNFRMIKGGGGALLREKILHTPAKQVVIAAESNKFVPSFTWPVPIEVHSFAIHSVSTNLEKFGKPKLRMLNEGYPYITQNGNYILDTSIQVTDAVAQERELKNIPGVLEVGLFEKADIYYKAHEDGSFEKIDVSP